MWNDHRLFDISLWNGGKLGAICLGKPKKEKSAVTLDLIGSTPEKSSPLGKRAFSMISDAAVLYAELVEATEIWTVEPLPAVRNYYSKHGYGSLEKINRNAVQRMRLL